MGLTRTTARKVVRGKAPRNGLGVVPRAFAVRKQSPVAISVKKPHRFRPSAVALREIRRYQKSTGLRIRKQRLVHEIAQNPKNRPSVPMVRPRDFAGGRRGFPGPVVQRNEPCRNPRRARAIRPKDLALARRLRGERS